MNEYLFYTCEGFTFAPNEETEVENCQLLGRAKGKSRKDAFKNLLAQNPWIEADGFDTNEIMCEQIINSSLRADISKIIEYLWHDEEKHFEENDKPRNHIFKVLKRLAAI